MNWFIEVLKKYAVFGGRAGRREYWHFALVYFLVSVVLAILDMIVGSFDPRTGFGLMSGLFALATALPALGVAVRRLHDVGRSAWWLLIALLPLIGAVVLIVFSAMKSEPGDNRFGPVPPADV